MNIYDFTLENIHGKTVSLKDYKGKVILIVNTASKCGFTPQYEDLQKLYARYHDQGFEILGFPCSQFMEQEFSNNEEIKSFCSINYGVTFPMFKKINVNGRGAHPLYKHLKENAPFKGFDMNNSTNKILNAMIKEKFPQFSIGNEIRWNFTKFLVDQGGNIVERFESAVDPMDIESYLLNYIKK
ncbi:MAG: glutathione peroxidase [Clostridiaceae bacterium]|nr:glutathione peroxidase [Clostridiaceae bacterium]